VAETRAEPALDALSLFLPDVRYCGTGSVSDDVANPSGGDIENPATLLSRGEVGCGSAWTFPRP